LDEFIEHPDEVFIMDRRRDAESVSISQLSRMDEAQLARLREAFPSLGEAWFTGLIGGTARG
jgi:hypothetical protein